tara:strand:- start:2620 stop:2997 length:378 start_codon:yes stop_codon:yes gene_type:complete
MRNYTKIIKLYLLYMSSQIFKKPISIDILFSLLDKICEKTSKYYIIDMNSFKKMNYHEYDKDFFQSLKEYYHKSKLFYIERKHKYTSFVTVVRQICKYNQIAYVSNIKYNESKYNINYHIYFENN